MFWFRPSDPARICAIYFQIRENKRQVSDLEILFHFAKKLLEANAEVAFASGADFISTQVQFNENFVTCKSASV